MEKRKVIYGPIEKENWNQILLDLNIVNHSQNLGS